MEIILSESARLELGRLGISSEEALDATVLPDMIEELEDGKKEFYKRFDKKALKLTVVVEEQRRVVVLKAEWVVER